ncbi:MAG TPA: c-type cytochrome domain-containing protein, partial [Chthonomonadaceae bacterium]|nr:c-type cytochrome domain-containing protein [Chthonomonadaceae bacterium]
LLLSVVTGAAFGQGAPTYAKDIRPVLQARCVVCHSQANIGNAIISGGLALDSYAALKKGVVGKAGARAIFTAGKSGGSELMQRLTATSPTKLMPKGGPPLPPAQIALFKKWIDGGALPGDLPKTSSAAQPSLASLPMPANPGALDVRLATLIKPTPDLVKKDMPKDAAFTFALKVGPLPAITALAFSLDGKRLAVGGYRAVTLWDTAKGQPEKCLVGLPGPVQSLAFRPDGAQLAVAGGAPGVAGEVRVYDTKTWALVGKPLGGHTDVVYSVAWSPDGTRLATASQDKTARLWEWPSGKELQVFRDHSDAVTRVCFAPDGKSVYTASQDHNVRRFDVANGQVIRAFTGHGDSVLALALSPDGKGLVSSGPEPRLRWWNVDSGDTSRYSDGHGSTVNEIVFSKDGKFLASASADGTVRLWDAGSGGQQRALAGASDWLYSVALSPDGKWTAGAGVDGIVRLWETANGRLRLALLAWPPAGKATTPEWAALTPEGYYDASPAWAKLLRPLLAGQPVKTPRLASFFQTLHQPANVAKSWQAAALEPAALPAPAAPPNK